MMTVTPNEFELYTVNLKSKHWFSICYDIVVFFSLWLDICAMVKYNCCVHDKEMMKWMIWTFIENSVYWLAVRCKRIEQTSEHSRRIDKDGLWKANYYPAQLKPIEHTFNIVSYRDVAGARQNEIDIMTLMR